MAAMKTLSLQAAAVMLLTFCGVALAQGSVCRVWCGVCMCVTRGVCMCGMCMCGMCMCGMCMCGMCV
jgi:hypothetical protein